MRGFYYYDNASMTKMTTYRAVSVIFFPWCDAEQPAIAYDLYETPFGRVGIATTSHGVCAVTFVASGAAMEKELHALYPHTSVRRASTVLQRRAHRAIRHPASARRQAIPLHVRGTAFQLRVWAALCTVPCGATISYGALAAAANAAGAARAVGSAMARNPIALLVPCHRVVRSDGTVGHYAFGTARKKRLLQWEEAQCA